MRTFRLGVFLGGKVLPRACFSLFVISTICISSCEDDLKRDKTFTSISFTPEIQAGWGTLARSMTGTDMPRGSVSPLQGGRTPLYLHTLYTDSIAVSSFSKGEDAAARMTRAARVSAENMYDHFGVSAYAYTGDWDESRTTPSYFHNATATRSGSDYTLSSAYYWPGASYKMRFFAYAPKENARYVFSGQGQAGSPRISVTVPEEVGQQEDLLVARSAELNGNSNTAVALTFNHALTAVRFVCGNDMRGGTVKQVRLKNVYSKGTYNMGTQTWSGLDTPATFSQTLDKVTTGTADEALTSEAQTFMMLPQRLPEDAQIEVLFTDDTHTDHTLTADIKGSEWPMGKTVTYKISSSSLNWTYTLDVTALADFTYTGGTQQYRVTSYRQNAQGEKEAAEWTTQYAEDGTTWTDTKPVWLTAFTASGTGGDSAQPCDATVEAQTGISNDLHTAALKAATAKGSETTPYNLSSSTGGSSVENTANCYVVSAPGYYSLPLVYGNAIKNAATNASAYTSTATGNNILNPFINHAGNGITDPYISGNGCTPAKAELVWQDAMNLVTDIKYNAGYNGGNISFKVDRSSIRQGNAVIAIKDASDAILWSWHVWVTDEDINNVIEITNHQNVKYNFMPVNLGQCDGNTITYEERSCKVKFTAGDQSKEITIKQLANVIATGSNAPFYQWGRKDPLYPSNGMDNTTKIWYDKEGMPSTANPMQGTFSTGNDCIKNCILNPNLMHNKNFGDNTYYNLWSADNKTTSANDNPVIKTIYDPCPVGFKLPASNAFTGFTTTGESASSSTQVNGTWSSLEKGWYFYTNSEKTQHIFFTALGRRSYTSMLVGGTGRQCLFWSAHSVAKNKNYYLFANSTSVQPTYTADRGFGHALRPCQD
ncbi:fimbrillin family protein [Bacteroides caccae]|uniref:fimbrillin family protein n=1 Tax=Bacteroides caccae TaxID=47678 RepID=UPI0028F42DC7|nr:fimbrillin family protein [Bacteroides caccae]WOG11686.1 fimbrillin family protein [Bacteroides caccae]